MSTTGNIFTLLGVVDTAVTADDDALGKANEAGQFARCRSFANIGTRF